MIKLLAVTPNHLDPTSYYRGMGPLLKLARDTDQLQIQTPERGPDGLPRVNWNSLHAADLVFLQRPYTPEHQQILEFAAAWNKPTWIDYDDLLTGLPPDNPAYAIYGSPSVQRILKNCLELASLITVSTPALADGLRLVVPDLPPEAVQVIPNAWDHETWPLLPPRAREKLFFWRGSKTHERDLMVHRDAMIAAAKLRPEHRWHFAGYNPWMITEPLSRALKPGQVTSTEADPFHAYLHRMRGMAPAVMAVPLCDHPFNRSKSNIAFLEATYAGALTVAPNLPEWRQPGVITYGAPDGITAALVQAADAPRSTFEIARQTVIDHFDLKQHNQARLKLISKLVAVG